ncbi:MAG: hypothetical protein D6798_17345 [Deltaproteobacteria bacterium]|nr:MAG: hypothetical protein D6798_17345 [Deltaproteobacteria bacterium]
MGTAERAILVAAALATSVAFLLLAPGGPDPGWILGLARPMLATAASLAGIVGAGAALVARLDPDLLDDERALLHATTWGLAAWALLASGLAFIGRLEGPVAAALPLLLSLGWLARPRLARPRPSAAAAILAMAVVVPALISVLAPAVDTDELYQHLALPRDLLRTGHLQGGLLHPDGSRPMALHAVYASAMALGGDRCVRLLHLALGLVVLDGVRAMGRSFLGPRGAWAPLMLLGSWTVVQPLGVAGSDLPTMLAAAAALDAALRGRVRSLTVAAAVALQLKYTAAGALLGTFLVAKLPVRWRLLAGAAALSSLAPWWLRNLAEGLHPLFPFAGWDPSPVHPGAPGAADMPFQYLDKYGAGRDPLDLLLLPVHAVLTARPDSFRFLGRLHPLFLALVPTALLALRTREPGPSARRLLVVAGIGSLAWAVGPHWLRYLMPALPALALWLAAGAPEGRGLPRLALGACFVAGLPANWAPLWVAAADALPAATGQEPATRYVERKHPPARAIAWANAHLPDDAVVALLFDWSRALVERPVLLGSVEDHVPVRHWLLTRGDRALSDLAAAGATHLVVTRQRFLPSTYWFLTDAERARDLDAPVALLDELLLRQATLIHQDGRTAIYELDIPGPPTSNPDP